jgi:hypothetical protein
MRRLNFRDWKIVDVDHFMKGNSYFSKIEPDRKFFENIDHYLGEDRVFDDKNVDLAKKSDETID